ncbi:MAG: sugar phosphate isomerase/epimerase [Elusimicrobia bacterium]|nr:sugar phosphate isomerase/epimerase [Elusimicrobiota bacterium]
MRIGTILELNQVAKKIFIPVLNRLHRHPISDEVERLAEAGAEHFEFTVDLLMVHSKTRDVFTAERKRLAEMAKSRGFTYSFHLPVSGGFCTGSAWEGVRKGSVQWLKEFVEWAKPMEPWGYNMHSKALDDLCCLDLGPDEKRSYAVQKIYEYFVNKLIVPLEKLSIEEIKKFMDPAKIFLENTHYADYYLFGNFPNTCGYSVCMDVGHIYLARQTVHEFVKKYGRVLRHVHLHDVIERPERKPWGRRDHFALGTGMVDVKGVIGELAKINFSGAIVLEVYYHDPADSIRYLKRAIEEQEQAGRKA